MSTGGTYDPHAVEAEIYRQWEEGGYFRAEPGDDAEATRQSDEATERRSVGGRAVEGGASDADASSLRLSVSPSLGRRPYTIVIPPPNVTGALHLGHALNNTCQDILIRWRRMCGDAAEWMPGTDHAGIATQAVVEKRLRIEEGLTRHELGREGLVERIWKWKEEYNERIIGQLRKMGFSCDWQRTRFTLDEVCARAVYHAFFEFFKAGLIYRGKRLVNWDVALQTAVADDEIEHVKVKGHLWHVRYPILEERDEETERRRDEVRSAAGAASTRGAASDAHTSSLRLFVSPSLVAEAIERTVAENAVAGRDYLVVATTRPETMLADTAVAVHPDDPRYKHLIGRNVLLPLMNRPIPIIGDGILVNPEFGTGCVKVTPGHDPNDAACQQRNPQIGIIDLLTPDGRINENGKGSGIGDQGSGEDHTRSPIPDPRSLSFDYSGLTKEEARKRVVADLESLGLLEKVEPYETEIGHSDRSKTPIEPLRSEQWFMRTDTAPHGHSAGPLAEEAMEAVRDGRVRFFPSRYAKTYLDWLGEKRDWCISRQLWWGHRIPVWRLRFQEEWLSPSAPADRRRSLFRESVSKLADFLQSYGWLTKTTLEDHWTHQEVSADTVHLCSRTSECRAALNTLATWKSAYEASGGGAALHQESGDRLNIGDSALAERVGEVLKDKQWVGSITYDSDAAKRADAVAFAHLDLESADQDLVPSFRNDCAELAVILAELEEDPDVLDTWFSSALWPMSTFGWPHERGSGIGDQGSGETETRSPIPDPRSPTQTRSPSQRDFEFFFPTDVLATGRGIITLWVARMVMMSLYFTRRVPFRHVYIHPIIQDGQGRTMSKSVGNGVDPSDLINLYGTDAMRFVLAQMATETQDLRVPVSYHCPHCNGLSPHSSVVPHNKVPAEIDRVKCRQCGREFATAWAPAALKQELGVGLDTSEKFELGRNFCNKLWQAATGFVLPNVKDVRIERGANGLHTSRPPAELDLFDRWIRTRLSRCIDTVTEHLTAYRFAQAAEALRTFFWSEFCDWYLEECKVRLQEGSDEQRNDLKIVMLQVLDLTLCLMHPIIPFVTEAAWARIGDEIPRHHELIWPDGGERSRDQEIERSRPAAGRESRSLDLSISRSPSRSDTPPMLIVAPWPQAWAAAVDRECERRVGDQLQPVIVALRDMLVRINAIRAQAKQTVLRTLPVAVIRCDAATADWLREQDASIRRLARCDAIEYGPDVARPAPAFSRVLTGIEVYVPVEGLADVEVEKKRLDKERTDLTGHLKRVQGKLANASFVDNAPVDVVERERARAAELAEKLAAIERNLRELQ